MAVTSRHTMTTTLSGGQKLCVKKQTQHTRHEAHIPHLRAKDGVLDSKESPSAPRGGKRSHPEVTTTTGAKKDGHRVKVRGAKNGIVGCKTVHTARKSHQPHKVAVKRGPPNEGGQAVCRAVHTARKSHQPHKGAERGSPSGRGRKIEAAFMQSQ